MNIIDLKHLIESKLYNDNFFKNHCYIVGGFVRDLLMDKSPKDMDIVVDEEHGSLKLALKVHQAFKTITTVPSRLGKYPIWRVTFIDGDFKGESIEIAETMSEKFPDKFSRQREVEFSSLEDDIKRRDFTINSLLMRFCCGEKINSIIDYSGYGIKDINKNHVIRCIPSVNAEEILSADPLRILRAIRFSIKYNWNIENNTLEAIKKVKDRIKILSVERIKQELENISSAEYGLLKAVKMFDNLEILEIIFPDIYKLKNMYQAPDGRYIHMEGSKYFCKNFEKKLN